MADTVSGANDSWALYVQRAAARVGGVQELADRAGIHRSTIYEYIGGTSTKKVTVERVVAIARASGDHPVSAFMAAAAIVEEEPQDREVGQILASDLPEDEQQRRIAVVMRRRDEDERRRMEDTQEFLRLHSERQAS